MEPTRPAQERFGARTGRRIAGSFSWLAMACIAWPPGSAAQEPPPLPLKPTVVVTRVARKPVLEDFLNMEAPSDLAASMARVDGGFIQRDPVDGDPASQHTDVYLGYDLEALYAVFVAFDSEPSGIRANLSRRENLFGDDIVHLQMDTFLDQRRAYTFICNPLGVQFDAIWTEGSEFDSSFDTVWSSRGQLTDRGYVVWMEIPFKSLRFPVAPEQVWGLILNRDIPRNNEESFWPRYTNRIQGRLNQAGLLRGLRDISPGRNVQFIPYATARSFRVLDPSDPSGGDSIVRRGEADAGVDAKFVFRDSLVLDVTGNPDFSQVESDQPQVTVNQRYEVYFPEKRPFFLENAGYFQTPINLLFTRRIEDPRLGARLTGKAGPWSVGTLAMDDRAQAPRARIGVLRASRDVMEQSNLGLMITHREVGDGFNRVGGIDARLKWNDHWNCTVQSAGSVTRAWQDLSAGGGRVAPKGSRFSGNALDLALNRSGRHFNSHFHYFDIAPWFRTDLGFVQRNDVREYHQDTGYTFRPEGPRLLSWTPAVFLLGAEDHLGARLDWRAEGSVRFEFRGQTAVEVEHQEGREALRPGDFPGLDHRLEFPARQTEVWVESRFSQRINVNAGLGWGSQINLVPASSDPPAPGHALFAETTLTLRPSARFRLDLDYLLTRLDDQASGAWIFTNQIVRLKAGVQIDPRTSIRIITQLDSLRTAGPELTSLATEKNLNADFLFSYLVNPWTAIYAGYNTNLRDPALAGSPQGVSLLSAHDGLRQDSRQVFLKLSYLLRP